MIYFFSDAHFGHKNICRGTSVWSDKDGRTRDFNTVEEMNAAIIKSINSRVGPDDTIYHIGDWSMGGWENVWHFRKQIVCKNIINVNGNHDEPIIKDKFFPFLEKQGDVIYEIADQKDWHVWTGVKTETDVTAKDIFKEVHNLLYLKVGKQLFVLSHEPFEIWRDKDKGSIHIHGHVHGGLDDCELNTKHKRKDVGWKNCIWSIDEVISEMSTRLVNFHH